jgi:protein TIF31
VPAVIVRLPKPNTARTLPKPTGDESYSQLTLLSQPSETVQELKLAVSEWVGGYWLGPYSLRLPGQTAEALSQSREGVDIRAGEKLSEWLEVGDVFAHLAEGDDERALEVVMGRYPVFL